MKWCSTNDKGLLLCSALVLSTRPLRLDGRRCLSSFRHWDTQIRKFSEAYLSIDDSSRLGDERVGNIATGKDFKTIIPGHWEVYRNGESVKDKNGRAITYSNTDQPGTDGFKYGF